MNYRGSTIFVVSQLLVGLDQCELRRRNCKQSKHKSSPRSNCRLASYVAVNDGVVWWLYQVRQSQSPSQTSICSNMDLPVQFGHTCLITQEGRGELLFPSFSFVCGLFIPIAYSRTEQIRFEKKFLTFYFSGERRKVETINYDWIRCWWKA